MYGLVLSISCDIPLFFLQVLFLVIVIKPRAYQATSQLLSYIFRLPPALNQYIYLVISCDDVINSPLPEEGLKKVYWI